MSSLFGVWLALSAGVAAYAILTLPSWLTSAINRSCLWRLRDEVFDYRRDGDLADGPQVQQFIDLIESLIVLAPKITALQLWWLKRRYGGREKGEARFPIRPLEGDDGQRDQFLRSQYCLGRIVMRQYITGSWSGLLVVLPRRFRVLRLLVLRNKDGEDAFVQLAKARFFHMPEPEPNNDRVEEVREEEGILNDSFQYVVPYATAQIGLPEAA